MLWNLSDLELNGAEYRDAFAFWEKAYCAAIEALGDADKAYGVAERALAIRRQVQAFYQYRADLETGEYKGTDSAYRPPNYHPIGDPPKGYCHCPWCGIHAHSKTGCA